MEREREDERIEVALGDNTFLTSEIIVAKKRESERKRYKEKKGQEYFLNTTNKKEGKGKKKR